MAASATLHCLTGCAIGEVLGLMIGTAAGLSNGPTTAIAVGLAFLFGYSLSTLPLIKSGLGVWPALRIVLAADTLSIATMEVVDNLVMLAIPGAMDAGLVNVVFWVGMAIALSVAFLAAYPVNRYLLRRGKGHALTHGYHGEQAASEGVRSRIPDLSSGMLVAVIASFMLGGLIVSIADELTGDADASSSTPGVSRSGYPLHTDVVATTFWVGEVFNRKVADGSQVCSTYDSQWAFHFSRVSRGRVPQRARACPGSRLGGCDGIVNHRRGTCRTERRTLRNGFFPTSGPRPRENPFYLDLPYDDLNDPIGFARRCEVIPWAGRPRYRGHCRDRSFSYMKNRWVAIAGPNGRTCYGQIEDAGPSHGRL